ncbi:TetR/AcrR family transcriptional regulator [Streptomyces sp. NPDC059479]|uniref:TetR/AcrR family transcriptional regulator n=1 Tax=Streptomyces sp. NPDC059479 TaxID=3346848 RepID=UPI0036921959
MTEQRNEPVRADARQNRARIIEVARDAFAASNEASLNSIAKQAGVGPGTLYRHFPTREALIMAVYRHEVERLGAYAPELLAEHTPMESLRLWLDRLAHYGRVKHGLSDVLHALTDEALAGKAYELVTGALTLLLRACEDAGAIRPDTDPDDVLLVLGFLWRISPGEEGEARAARLLDLIIDGLRFGAPATAPASASASAR